MKPKYVVWTAECGCKEYIPAEWQSVQAFDGSPIYTPKNDDENRIHCTKIELESIDGFRFVVKTRLCKAACQKLREIMKQPVQPLLASPFDLSAFK